MRLIGVLGGTSWPSTMIPYRLLNHDVQSRLGYPHSARIVLYSIDYSPIKELYNDGWARIPTLMKREIDVLLSFKPDCWMIANNTLHRAYDVIASDLPTDPIFFHAVYLVREELLERSIGRALLLGTRFTMEDGFFAKPLEAAGIEIIKPDLPDRELIQDIQTRLARGEINQGFESALRTMLLKYQSDGCEAVITACTELSLVVQQPTTEMHVIDPLVLQCRRCVDYALLDTATTHQRLLTAINCDTFRD